MQKCNISIEIIKTSNEFIQMRHCFWFQELYCALAILKNHQKLKELIRRWQPEYGDSGYYIMFPLLLFSLHYIEGVYNTVILQKKKVNAIFSLAENNIVISLGKSIDVVSISEL